jgi:hypothetical protein
MQIFDPESTQSEYAFYYPGPMTYSDDWLKNMILFFDGLAFLIPAYARSRLENENATIRSLREAGLVEVLEPETFVDKAATLELATAIVDYLASGALDTLANKDTAFHELSYSRLGGYGDQQLADFLIDELRKRGLARSSEDGVSVPLHPMVRSLVLVLLAQILRARSARLPYELSPATDNPSILEALREILSVPLAPSNGHVVKYDSQAVGIDAKSVPLDEILGFRRQFRAELRAYLRGVRSFVSELSRVPEPERDKMVRKRQKEIQELADKLRKAARKEWKRVGSFGLGILGAAWTVHTGDVFGGIVSGGAGLLSYERPDKPNVETFSYILRARKRFA